MKCNVGGMDRAGRSMIAIAALGTGLFAPVNAVARITLLALGGTAAFTVLTGYCPLNEALGVNTCEESLGKSAERVAEKVHKVWRNN